jgi:hypothetical protein
MIRIEQKTLGAYTSHLPTVFTYYLLNLNFLIPLPTHSFPHLSDLVSHNGGAPAPVLAAHRARVPEWLQPEAGGPDQLAGRPADAN